MFDHVRRLFATFVLAIGSVLLVTATAHAQTLRFVSSNGNDANTCTRSAPCRTLQRAVNVVPTGGEVQVLDAGGYGNSLNITKSVTVSADGVSATIGNIVINQATAIVVLRGLMLNGTLVASNANGITISNATAVHILNCQVERFAPFNGAIYIAADNADVFITDTIVRSNTFHGLLVGTSSSGTKLTIDNSRFENNSSDGIRAVGTGDTVITRVVATGNAGNGISNSFGRMSVMSTTSSNNGVSGFDVASAGQLTVESSTAHANTQRGLRATSSSVARVSNSAFTNSAVGLENISSTLLSRGNNTVSGNTANTTGTITALAGI